MAKRFFTRCTMLLLALLALLPLQAKQKPTYNISLKINGNKDSVMYLGYYYAKGNQVVDTARIDKKGRFVFTGTDTLQPGLYFFANPKGTYCEFVVYHEKPFFTFETEEKDWTTNMRCKGSAENDFFFDFHRIDSRVGDDLNEQHAKLDSAAFAQYRYRKLMQLDSIKLDLITRNPGRFLSRMMLATKDVETPLLDEHGDTLSYNARREYFLTHYFDNMCLDDDALIRTPKAVFYDRVMQYFDNYLKYAEPKTIIQYMDPVLDRAKPAPYVFQYLVLTLTQKYLQSNVSVYDEVYVHIVQKYYASDDNWWSTPSSIEKELTRATKYDRLLVGREAPELILFDTLHVPHSLHAMPNKWKLLIFWSPNCGHCKHIIPTVYEAFEKYRDQYDIGAFTILTEPDDKTRGEWHAFLKEHGMTHPAWLSLDGGEANVDWHDVYDIQSTPQIYLIDENNLITAKKLGENTIENAIKVFCGEAEN